MPFIQIEDCSHSGAHEEVMGGHRTGEYVCDRCGESWTTSGGVERAQADFKSRRATAAAGNPSDASPQ